MSVNQGIILVAIFVIYFHIGGLATTNILRLTAGNSRTINSAECKCDCCGYRIPPMLQLPIVSYIICKGKCKNCGNPIPLYPLLLECVVIIGMFLITLFFGVSPIGVTASFGFYELVRIVTVLLQGKRSNGFVKQYIVAVFSMIPFLLCSLFIAVLYMVV